MQNKKEVNYGPAEGPDKSCGTCVHFDGVNSCALVEGKVKATDICDLWTESKEKRGMGPEAKMSMEDMLFGGMGGGLPAMPEEV